MKSVFIQFQFLGLLLVFMAFASLSKASSNHLVEEGLFTCPELLIIPVNAVCGQSDGAVELTVTPPDNYTYSWSNGATTQNLMNVFEGTYTVTVTDADGCSATASATVMNWTSGFSLSGTTTNPTAGQSNGAIDLTVTPSGSYTYTWSNGATTEDLSNLDAGTYDVTVTNSAGCTEVTGFILTLDCDLTVTYTITPGLPFCPGEEVTLTLIPAGGTAPYTYLWTNDATTQSITFIAGGVITVDGSVTDANGCMAQVFIHLKSSIWQTFIQGYPSTCGQSDGLVDLTVIGGDVYEYNWSNGATTEDLIDVPAGTYTVTVTSSAGCTATASATVANNNSNLTLSGNTTPNTSCISSNGAVDLTVSPAGNYTYAWSNGATTEDLANLAAGTYSVTVTGGGNCSASGSFVVANNLQFPTPSLTTSPSTCGQNDGAVDLSVSPAGSYTYNWSNGATTEDLANILAGTYTVTVTSSEGCTATASATVTNNNSNLNISGATSSNTSCITPNGAVDITVSPAGSYTYAWSNGATTEDVANLAAGTYSVTVTGGGNCSASGSFVVSSNQQYPNPSLTPSASTCGQNDGAVDLSVSPAGSYTYNWSNGATTEDLIDVPEETYTVTVTSSEGCTATASATVTNNNSNLNISGTTSSNTSCITPNGAVDITVSPAGSYTYAWSNGATTEDVANLAAGTYSVTVTGGGNCSASGSFVVANNLQFPSPSLTTSPSTCGQNDGAADLSVSPAGSYTYNWSNGATTEDLANIPAGAYTVTVTSSEGCTATASATVANNNSNLTISGNTTPNTSCISSNGAVDLTVSPAGNYTYAWSNGATTEDLANLAAGTYSVTVSDANGCTATDLATVANNSASFSLSTVLVPNTSCVLPNGSVDLSVSPTGTYMYAWSNGATTEDLQNLAPGTYSVTVSDANGCTATDLATVANNSASFSLSTVLVPNTSCVLPNGSVDLSVSSAGNYMYAWSNGATTEDLQNLAPGTYSVTVSDANGCTATDLATVANNSASFSLSSVLVPNTSCVLPNGAVDLSVSASGNYTYGWSNGATTQDLQNLTPGTYSVTVSDANGCTATDLATVANNSASFSLSSVLVPNTSCVLPNGSVDLSVSSAGTYMYAWSNGATTEDLQNLAPGTYSVTVSDANGCTATDLATVANNSASFSLSTVLVPNTSCVLPNGSVDLSVSLTGTYMYAWSNGATTEDLQNLSPGTYSVTVSDANGCTATDLATVANNSASFSLSSVLVPNTSCVLPNGSVDLSISSAGTYIYLWSNGATTEDLQNLTPGTYSVTVSDANGCTATDLATVANNSASFSLSTVLVPNTSCVLPNGSVDLSVSSAGTYMYAWSNGATTEDLQNLAPGTYSVTVSDANGCTATDLATVANNIASFSLSTVLVPNTSCVLPNGSVDLSVSSAGNYMYAWSNGATTEDLQNLTPGTYSVTVSDANGCTATDLATVANNSASFSLSMVLVPNTSCVLPNGSVDLSVSLTGTYMYAWSNGATTEDLQNLTSGTYSVTVSDANGCTATDLATVANNSASFSLSTVLVPNTSCVLPNGSVDLSVSSAGTYMYAWSNGATTEDLQNLTPGTYSVTVSDANGCSATISGVLDQNTILPEINLSPIPAICGQSNGAITLNITAGLAPFTYIWSNGVSSQNLSNAAPGAFTVTVSAANGCTQTGGAIVENQGSFFAISANTFPNNSCLQPEGAVDLSLSTIGSFTYFWSNGATSEDLSGLAAGTYSVTVTEASGCSQTGNYILTDEHNAPNIEVKMSAGDCSNPIGSIEVEWIQGGAPPLNYSIDGGQHFSDVSLFDNLPPGDYQVMAEDANHCQTVIPVQIPSPLLPVILPLPDIDLALGQSQTLQVQLQAGFPLNQIDTVIWSPAIGLEFSGNSVQSLLQPSIQGIANQQYTVTILSSQGCEVRASFRLNVQTEKGLYAPNVIWPEDSDGNNTAFTLFTRPGSVREILILKIYDRWGNELFSREHFESDNLQLGWQGDFRGQPMNPAVFVWWAEVEWMDGVRSIHKGDVTVVR